MPEAGYFHYASRTSKLNVNLIQLTNEDESDKDPTARILRAVERIENFKAEVILLYTSKENTELMLRQVNVYLLNYSLSSNLSFLVIMFKKNVLTCQ